MTVQRNVLKTLKTATASAALIAFGGGISLTLAVPVAYAQGHGGGSEGHESGEDHQDSGGQGQRGGQGRTPGEATESRGNRSMEDIFRDVENADHGRPADAGSRGQGSSEEPHGEEEEDSDRPDYAGGGGGPNDRGGQPGDAGSARGDLYGDAVVILRDGNGVPILNEAGFVQPIDADGNLIPLDEEGAPIDPTLALEVEIGRLNVGRSPDQVLDRRAEEVVTLLNSATALELDAAGRLVVTSPDGTVKTIDAALENLAIYTALMTQGSIPGVVDLPGTEFDHLVDGVRTVEDMVSAVSFLAGASDKFSTLSLDAVAYVNAILGINNVTEGNVTWSSVDYSDYNYDRSDAYGDVTANILVKQPDGSWVPTEVNIYEVVFGNTDYSGTGTFESFATAVDDARAVILYTHEYTIPADEPPTKD